MPAWNDYSTKNSPADTDTLMLKDNAATGKPNKRLLFSGLWTWIIDKLTNAAINALQTTTKTVVGGMNNLQDAVTTLNSNMWKKASVTIPAGQTKSLVAGREELSCFVSITGPQTSIRAGLYYLSGYATATRVTLVPLNTSDNISFDMTNETTVTIPITNSSANPAALTVFVLRKTGNDITFQ